MNFYSIKYSTCIYYYYYYYL